MEHLCRCGWLRRPNQRTCRQCHAAYMRAHRPSYADLSVEQRHHARVRKRTLMQQRRGRRPRGPCARCGNPHAQNHHPDYDQPDWVERLCVVCHRSVGKNSGTAEEG